MVILLFLICLLSIDCQGLEKSHYGNQLDASEVINVAFPSANYTSILNSTQLNSTSEFNATARGRGLKNLTPGQEFLLSVASFDDAKTSNWENLPHLMSILQKGGIDIGSENAPDTRRKSSKVGLAALPMKMMDMMRVMIAVDRQDEDIKNSDEEDKPMGFLAKLAMDPMNLILAAIIPFSLLLAAVIPILTNQFMTGIYIPSVNTIVSGDRARSLDKKNSTEFFVPILESIASYSARALEDITQETPSEAKVKFAKETLHMITSFVNEKWLKLFGDTSKADSSCSKGKCLNPKIKK